MIFNRIKLLKDSLYGNKGDVLPISDETQQRIFFFDAFRRWRFFWKTREHEDFEYTSED